MTSRTQRVVMVSLAAVAVSALVWSGYATSASRWSERLEVANVSVQLPPRGGDGAGLTGRLGASRSGDRACFWISASRRGEERLYLLFARNYSASRALALLDEQGKTVARVGETVTASIAAPRPDAAPSFCPPGTGMTVFDVARLPSQRIAEAGSNAQPSS